MGEAILQAITLQELRNRREQILNLSNQHGAYNVRAFGSVAHGEAVCASDVDFLMQFREGTSIFDLVGLWLDLQELLGCEVDLIADHPSGGRIMRVAFNEAIPL